MIDLREVEIREIERLAAALGHEVDSILTARFRGATSARELDLKERREWINFLRAYKRGEVMTEPIPVQPQLPWRSNA